MEQAKSMIVVFWNKRKVSDTTQGKQLIIESGLIYYLADKKNDLWKKIEFIFIVLSWKITSK